ncbi:MAG TPA: nucleotidyltransferase family protein, partial [Gemmatimonadaceae bacterium]|nr:nucleotidyltransferase family protein [Gemmatimonadaceae bacterium]
MRPAVGARRCLTPEQAALLVIGGTASDGEVADALDGVDWQALLALAATERAGAELHRRVRQLAGVSLPRQVSAALQRMAMVSEFEMAQLRECLLVALSTVRSLDARVMLLKGTALVHSVYDGTFGRRPMADIDVLVDPSRATDVWHALVRAGWRETVASDRTSAYREHHHLPPLQDARGSHVRLEIHTALFADGHPFGLTPEALWSHAEILPLVAGARDRETRGVYVPAMAHQLLHLCLHFAWSHVMRFGAWRAFRDVNAILASGRIDWDAFTVLAREARAATSCYWTFRLANTLADVPVPAGIIDAFRPSRPAFVLRGLERHYARNLFPLARVSPSVRLDRALWDLGMLPSQSGHGAARPWNHDSHFQSSAPPPANVRPPGRAASQLWRA